MSPEREREQEREQEQAEALSASWNADRPLEGLRIVITRAEDKGIVLKKALRDRGAIVLNVPCIRFGPPEDGGPMEEALGRLDEYTWILFTSTTGVEAFFEKARELGVPGSTWNRFRFGAVGPSTGSQLASMGIQARQMVLASTAQALRHTLLPGEGEPLLTPADRCLFPQGDLGRQELQEGLKECEIPFDHVVAYRTLPEAREMAQPFLHALAARQPVAGIAFASPSALENFLIMTAPDGERAIREQDIALFSMGPTTSRAIVDRGFEVSAEADPYTTTGLRRSIQRYFAPDSLLDEDRREPGPEPPHDLTALPDGGSPDSPTSGSS